MSVEPLQNPRLDSSHQVRDASHYTHIRTLAEKFGVPEEHIDDIQARYAVAYNASGIFVSRKDEIPGYRRVVLLDPLWSPQSEAPEFTLYAVDDSGRLSARSFPRSQFGDEYPSALSLLAAEPAIRSAKSVRPDLEMNRFATAYREAPAQVLHRLSTSVVLPHWDMMTVPDPFSQDSRHKSDAQRKAEEAECSALHRLRATLAAMGKSRIVSGHGLACYAIMDALDPDIAGIMRSSQCTTTQAALWLSGQDRHASSLGDPSATARLSLYRRQACRSYPSLARYMARDGMFNDKIDSGLPLAPAIAAELGLEDREVRVLNGLSWQKIQSRPHLDLDTIAMAAKTGLYLQKLNRTSFGHGKAISHIADKIGVNGREVAAKTSAVLAGKGPDASRLMSRVLDSTDMLQYLVRHLHVPAAMIALKHREKAACDQDLSDTPNMRILPVDEDLDTHGFEKNMMGALFRGTGLKDLIANSDRWHRNLPAHQDHIEQFMDDVRWTEMLPLQDLGHGMTARELTSSLALTRQGEREQHCVGGYSRSVVSSGTKRFTQIWSIERDDRILGTLELSGRILTNDQGARRLSCSIMQLRGYRNSIVDPECTDAAKGLLKRLEDAGPECLDRWLVGVGRANKSQSSLARVPKSIRQAGYNFWAEGAFERVWAELSVYLPRSVRKAGPETFIASMDGALKMPLHEIRVSNLYETGLARFSARSGSRITLTPAGTDSDVDMEIRRILEQKPLGIRPFWERAQETVDSIKGEKCEKGIRPWDLGSVIDRHIRENSDIMQVVRECPGISQAELEAEACPNDDEIPF